MDEEWRCRWLSPLAVRILPRLGSVPVEALDRNIIRDVLPPIWHLKAGA